MSVSNSRVPRVSGQNLTCPGNLTVLGELNAVIDPIFPGLGAGVLHSDAKGNITSSLVVGADVSSSAALNVASVTVPVGSAAAPTVKFSGDAKSGLYQSASGAVDIAANGADLVTVNSSGMTVNSGVMKVPMGAQNAPGLTFNDGTGSGIYMQATGTIGFTCEGNAPTMELTSSYVNVPVLSASSLVATDSLKNLSSSVSGLSPGFTGLNVSGLTASTLVATDGSKNLSSSVSGLTPGFTGLNVSGLTASTLVATDGSKNLSSSVSGLSPGFTGLNVSGLTASTLVATDVSKNLTSSVSGLTPGFTGLNVSGLTASSLVATDGSKNLTSTVSGLSPSMTGLTLSGLTASSLVATNGSKGLTSTISGLSPTMTGLTLTGALHANGFTYPSTDSSAGAILVTDGSKNLSLVPISYGYAGYYGGGYTKALTNLAAIATANRDDGSSNSNMNLIDSGLSPTVTGVFRISFSVSFLAASTAVFYAYISINGNVASPAAQCQSGTYTNMSICYTGSVTSGTNIEVKMSTSSNQTITIYYWSLTADRVDL